MTQICETTTQLRLFDLPEVEIETPFTPLKGAQPVELLPLNEYDFILVSESGGKDSMGCLFHLQDLGVDMSKVQLWHQNVDGGPTDLEIMDWPSTHAYIDAVGKLFGVKVAYQWRAGGIYGEMMRKDSLTGDVYYTTDDGQVICLPTTRGKQSTRLKWPAMSPDLRTRYCSAYAKIDVFRRVVNSHPLFKGSRENPVKVLTVTGERREESPNRAKYLEAEIHACHSPNQGRIVHAWRPVIDMKERDIWDMYEKRRFMPHLAYTLGWNRTSCFACIFSTADLWAMMRDIAPERFNRLVEIEKEINHTIDSKMDLVTKANLGSLDRLPKDQRLSQWVHRALSREVFRPEELIMDKWELPAGAMRGSKGGPL